MDYTIEHIIDHAVKMNASDIHIVTDEPIVLRVHGELMVYTSQKATSEYTSTLLKRLCRSERNLTNYEKNMDVDFSTQINSTRIRVNAHREKKGHAFSIRIVSSKIPTIDSLGLPQAVKTFSDLKKGLVLVTGPTGSGKSTTQAAIIRHICETRKAHIITIEDPIEYDFDNIEKQPGTIIEQREVGIHTPNFNYALKHALRQDPDVLLIGEIRDYETISTALTAAETGHLVITTLHTQDASQSIDRMIDSFPSNQQQQVRSQLSMCLEAICSQRLFTNLDKSGSAVAMEILIAIPAVRNLIRTMKTHEIYSMIEINKKYGMQTFESSMLQLIASGKICETDARPYLSQTQSIREHDEAIQE